VIVLSFLVLSGDCLVLSCPVIVLSCLVMVFSCLVWGWSRFVLSYPVLSCLVSSCLASSRLVLSCLVLSRLVSSRPVLSCLVLYCLVVIVLSCLVLPCLALPCLVLSCFALPCLVSSCLVLNEFRYTMNGHIAVMIPMIAQAVLPEAFRLGGERESYFPSTTFCNLDICIVNVALFPYMTFVLILIFVFSCCAYILGELSGMSCLMGFVVGLAITIMGI
jgi:hypothetical protein